jgi:hypothetical protein
LSKEKTKSNSYQTDKKKNREPTEINNEIEKANA